MLLLCKNECICVCERKCLSVDRHRHRNLLGPRPRSMRGINAFASRNILFRNNNIYASTSGEDENVDLFEVLRMVHSVSIVFRLTGERARNVLCCEPGSITHWLSFTLLFQPSWTSVLNSFLIDRFVVVDCVLLVAYNLQFYASSISSYDIKYIHLGIHTIAVTARLKWVK